MIRRLWIAVEAHLVSRDVTLRCVTWCDVSRATALGHLVSMWGQVAEDAKSGDVSDVSDATLEVWACWEGEPGRFAAFIREHCVTDGCITGWADMQAPLEASREKAKLRQRVHREKEKLESRDRNVTSRATEQNRTVTVQKKVLTTTPPSAAVVEVVEHYKLRHPNRKPGDAARRLIAARLKTRSAEEIKRAIDGNATSDFHREKGFHDLELILREGKMDNFIAMATPFVPRMTELEWLDGDPIQSDGDGLTEKGDLMLNEERKLEWIREQRRCGMIP